jgi:hypothetical protein
MIFNVLNCVVSQILEVGEQEGGGGPASLSCYAMQEDLSHCFQRWRMDRDLAYKATGSLSQSD